jgi:hypothetical protein
MALATVVLCEASTFNVTQLASFASHDAFDHLNLMRWSSSAFGLPIPQKFVGGMLGGAGVVLVPYLSQALSVELHEQLPSLLGRFSELRQALVESRRG